MLKKRSCGRMDKRFEGNVNWKVSVRGLDLIFKVLCLICKIMIYRLPVRDSIDRVSVDKFIKQLEELEE
jgi:hypothetical protein